jgi:hypothetical protein
MCNDEAFIQRMKCMHAAWDTYFHRRKKGSFEISTVERMKCMYTCSIPSLQVEPGLVDCQLHETKVLSIRGVNSRKQKHPLSNNMILSPVCVCVLLMLTHVSHLFPQSISSAACYCYFLLYMRICIQGRAFPARLPARRHSSFVIVEHFKEKGAQKLSKLHAAAGSN